MKIESGEECSIYYKVINIVNIPPNIPPEIQGMDMTCTAPITEYPRDSIERSWCQGGLIQYFDILNLNAR